MEFKSHRNVRRESSLYPPFFLGLRRYLASLPRDDRAELGFERLGKGRSELHAHGADKFIDSRLNKRWGAGMKLLIAPMGGGGKRDLLSDPLKDRPFAARGRR